MGDRVAGPFSPKTKLSLKLDSLRPFLHIARTFEKPNRSQFAALRQGQPDPFRAASRGGRPAEPGRALSARAPPYYRRRPADQSADDRLSDLRQAEPGEDQRRADLPRAHGGP